MSLRRENLLIYLKLKMGEFQYRVHELRIIPTSLIILTLNTCDFTSAFIMYRSVHCVFGCVLGRCLLDDFLHGSVGPSGEVEELHFEQLPFNHPLFIMYSSGTTGAPKCMVHSAGVSSLVFILCVWYIPRG